MYKIDFNGRNTFSILLWVDDGRRPIAIYHQNVSGGLNYKFVALNNLNLPYYFHVMILIRRIVYIGPF